MSDMDLLLRLGLPNTHTLLCALPEPGRDLLAGIGAVLGAPTRYHALSEERFAPCKGCFECWVDSPGTCQTRDAAKGVMADIIASEETVWIARAPFGAWDSLSKSVLDRTIGLISPFFETINGETHHYPRYSSYPVMGVIIVEAHLSDERKARIRTLVERNALNFHAPASWVAFVAPHAPAEEVAAAVRMAREHAAYRPLRLSPFVAREAPAGVAPGNRARHALIWVGSARPAGTSTSELLGNALATRLQSRGWTTELVRSSALIKLPAAEAPRLVEAVARADLLVLASPIYVDCLPALVLAGLERLAREPHGPRPALLPILQAGFPEISHTILALHLLADFAQSAGFAWAGHLAMGGGGLLTGADLNEANGKAWNQVAALDLGAEALDRGEPVPAVASDRFATLPISTFAYRLAGQAGWIWQALKRGSLFSLHAQPFPTAAPHSVDLDR